MRDLVSRTILSTKSFLKDEALLPLKRVEEIKADMDRLGLAYALLVAEQFKQYDQIPDWLKRQDDSQANFKRRIIAAYPELEQICNGKKLYWCPVAKRWDYAGEMRALILYRITSDTLKSAAYLVNLTMDMSMSGMLEMGFIWIERSKRALIKGKSLLSLMMTQMTGRDGDYKSSTNLFLRTR